MFYRQTIKTGLKTAKNRLRANKKGRRETGPITRKAVRMTTPLYLKTKSKTIPAALKVYQGALILTAAGQSVELAGSPLELIILANTIIAAQRPVRQNEWTITPEQVIRYFEQSDVLRVHAADVRAVLGSEIGPATPKANPLEADLLAVKHLINPSPADLAEVLLGTRYYSGSGYRRVKAVQAALNSSSSPLKNDFSGGEEDKKAA